MAEKTRVFALVAGINAYPAAPLAGCVSDAQKMLAYLKRDPSLEVVEQTLFDKQATKEALVAAFRSHLGRAGAGEAAFFYFSGHGAREKASRTVWVNESDDTLECLACYSAGGMPSLLADKELRYLIREIAAGRPEQPKPQPPHILTVFDCCHSGDNTRASAFMAKRPKVKQKRFTSVFPQRQWADFIFADRLKEEDFAARPVAELLPEGPHVQLAAALDSQPALEVGDEGLFTRNLIKVLEDTNGALSYASLHNIVSNYIRHQYQQYPQLYVQGGDPNLVYSGFLGKEVSAGGMAAGRVLYDKAQGWLLNLGAMHGVSERSELEILPEDGTIVTPAIERITPNETFLDLDREDRSRLDKTKMYSCRVAAFSSYPISVFIKNEDGDEALLKALREALDGYSARIQLTEQEADADYLLHIRYGGLFITPPFLHHYPLARPVAVDGDGALAIKSILHYLDHIAKWEYVKKLHNENVKLFKGKPPLRVSVSYQDGDDWRPCPYLEKGAAIEKLEWVAQKNTYRSLLKVELANESGRDLYYSFFFLTVNFESSGALMEKQVELIRAGETAAIFKHKGGIIPFSIEQQILDYNVPETKAWFKIFISTQQDINTALMTLKALPPPAAVFKPRDRGRGFDTSDEDLALAHSHDWTTMLIPLTFKNPRYNRVSEERLMRILGQQPDEGVDGDII